MTITYHRISILWITQLLSRMLDDAYGMQLPVFMVSELGMLKRRFVVCHFLAPFRGMQWVQWSAERWLAVWKHGVGHLMQLFHCLNSCVNVIFTLFYFLMHVHESSIGGYKNEIVLGKFKTQGLFPLHISLSMMDLQTISHFNCQIHSLAVFYNNLHCITSTMAQAPVLVAKFLFDAVQLSALKRPSSICI